MKRIRMGQLDETGNRIFLAQRRGDAEDGRMNENQIGSIIIEAAIEAHRHLGPGLLESVYETVLDHELTSRGLSVQRQVPVPIQYKGIRFDEGFRADLIVNGLVIIELKSVEALSAAHRKQLQTYLRLTGAKLGYLLNFGAALMKEGMVRAVNGLEESPLCASASRRENPLSTKPNPERL